MKIAFLSAECAPFAKVGGLADVVAALPPALQKIGVSPALFLRLHSAITPQSLDAKKVAAFSVPFAGTKEIVTVYKTALPHSRLAVYFLSNQKYFDKNPIYDDDLKKYVFYSLAALEAMKKLQFKPDVIHLHDHQTGLVPRIVKTHYGADEFFAKTKTVFTIHNVDYQGRTNPRIINLLDHTIKTLPDIVNDLKDGDINFMVQGILSADAITTVSPRYAREILKPAFGFGIDNILRKRRRDLYGILNGIDTASYNPKTDKQIAHRYSLATLRRKEVNKFALQKKVGLPQASDVALVGFVARLVYQKGIELIDENLLKLNCQFVILGTGEARYESYVKKLAQAYPDKFAAEVMFDSALARQIYAASDIFLVPSRYEPCGLTQMIAMRYGSVPLVRATGGLADTVRERRKPNGFLFKDFSAQALHKMLQRALHLYYKKPNKWRKLQGNGMKEDFSWKKSAKEYVKIYEKVLKKP
ncbi:MAG: glycogen/starch synthase [Patescibacteria group bacterium]|jgi:starch synthase